MQSCGTLGLLCSLDVTLDGGLQGCWAVGRLRCWSVDLHGYRTGHVAAGLPVWNLAVGLPGH